MLKTCQLAASEAFEALKGPWEGKCQRSVSKPGHGKGQSKQRKAVESCWEGFEGFERQSKAAGKVLRVLRVLRVAENVPDSSFEAQ